MQKAIAFVALIIALMFIGSIIFFLVNVIIFILKIIMGA